MKKNKLNSNGFMLVEVIIVTVIVATIMTSLYIAFTRIYKVYDMKSKYSNIDGIYALNTIRNYYIENITLNKLINDSTTNTPYYIDLKTDTENTKKYCSTLEGINYCNNISSVIKNYNINSLYIVKVDSNLQQGLKNLRNSDNITETFKEYIDYLLEIGIDGLMYSDNNYINETSNNTLDNNYVIPIPNNTNNNYKLKSMNQSSRMYVGNIFLIEFASTNNSDKVYDYGYLPVLLIDNTHR